MTANAIRSTAHRSGDFLPKTESALKPMYCAAKKPDFFSTSVKTPRGGNAGARPPRAKRLQLFRAASPSMPRAAARYA